MYSVLDLQKLVQMLNFLGFAPNIAPPHYVVIGGGSVAPGAAGTIFGSNGVSADPSFQTLASLGIQPAGTYAPLPLPAASVGASQLGANVVGDGQIAWGRILKRVVSSLAALAALNVSIYQEAFATDFGHGVGGGGAYSYNASTPVASADGGSIIAAAGGVGCWMLQHNGIVDVLQFGAVGDGATDDYPAITAALASKASIVMMPPLPYRVSAGITVPAFKSLKGQSFGAYATGAITDSAPLIIGDLAIPTIVTVVGGGAEEGVALSDVMVNRVAGAVPAGSIGVAVTNSFANLSVQDVTSLRSAIGFSTGAGTSTGLGVHYLRCYTGQVTQFHVQISNAVETTFTECRFGRNGGLDVNTTAYVNINGAAVDTVRFQTCQFNQGGGQAASLVSFTGYASNVNGIISFNHCHAEQISSSVVLVDAASSAVRRLRFVGNTIDAGAGDTFYFGAAAMLTELMLVGNAFDGGFAVTLDQQTSSVITGNNITGPVLINQGTQIVTGNFFQGNVTLQGATARTVFVGNGVAGTLTNTMTGTTAIANNI